MSAETSLQALLVADAGIRTVLGDVDYDERFAADRIEQDTGRPFGVYTRAATENFEGLGGDILAAKVTFELQLWADTRLDADELADACQTAIRAAGHAVTGRSSGYDAELDLEATVLTLEWWE